MQQAGSLSWLQKAGVDAICRQVNHQSREICAVQLPDLALQAVADFVTGMMQLLHIPTVCNASARVSHTCRATEQTRPHITRVVSVDVELNVVTNANRDCLGLCFRNSGRSLHLLVAVAVTCLSFVNEGAFDRTCRLLAYCFASATNMWNPIPRHLGRADSSSEGISSMVAVARCRKLAAALSLTRVVCLAATSLTNYVNIVNGL